MYRTVMTIAFVYEGYKLVFSSVPMFLDVPDYAYGTIGWSRIETQVFPFIVTLILLTGLFSHF